MPIGDWGVWEGSSLVCTGGHFGDPLMDKNWYFGCSLGHFIFTGRIWTWPHHQDKKAPDFLEEVFEIARHSFLKVMILSFMYNMHVPSLALALAKSLDPQRL